MTPTGSGGADDRVGNRGPSSAKTCAGGFAAVTPHREPAGKALSHHFSYGAQRGPEQGRHRLGWQKPACPTQPWPPHPRALTTRAGVEEADGWGEQPRVVREGFLGEKAALKEDSYPQQVTGRTRRH